MKPVIYLDVDGVLNALDVVEKAEGDDCWGDFEVHANVTPTNIPAFGRGYDLCMSKKMVAELASLDADVKWLTTWRQDAAEHVAPLVDAPDWPVVDWTVEKGAALAQDQAYNPRPFVWIDDWEATEGNVKYFLMEPEVPYLLIKPNAYSGITRKQMEEIREFIESVS